jgi:hypothetical protein
VRQIDDPITHHAAVKQQIARWYQPIADVIRKNAIAQPGSRDLPCEVGIPPDVVGVDCDADSVAQGVAQVQRLRERIYTSAVGRIHRVQRLDGQRHVV